MTEQGESQGDCFLNFTTPTLWHCSLIIKSDVVLANDLSENNSYTSVS